jgi:hypothetical protein
MVLSYGFGAILADTSHTVHRVHTIEVHRVHRPIRAIRRRRAHGGKRQETPLPVPPEMVVRLNAERVKGRGSQFTVIRGANSEWYAA